MRARTRAHADARAHAHRRAHGSQELAEIGVDEAVRAAIRASTAQASRWRCPPRFHGGATLQLAAASRAGVATANMRRLLRGARARSAERPHWGMALARSPAGLLLWTDSAARGSAAPAVEAPRCPGARQWGGGKGA